ncbi:MAG TPA: sugar ABC transporter permease [Clostridiaceae bacterium]|nr:sugar ABC transporter permease [Clostridiaceae bacterium]
MNVKRDEKIGVILFLLPVLILFIAFFVYPVIYLVIMSFNKWSGFDAPVFTGLTNYIKIFTDKVFIRSITNNIIWALVAGFVQVPLAVLTAILLSYKPRGWKIFRTVYFFPQVISGVALATLWSAVYNAQYGMLNGILRILGLGHLEKNWLGSLDTAFPALLIYWVFYVGYFMVIILADIQSIPEDYYEAADIDGASRIRQSISITVPLAKTSIVTCMLLAMINGMRQFEQVYMLTNGGPSNRTSVMVLYLYKEMQNYAYGTSSAAAVVLICVGTIVILTLRNTIGRPNY